MQKIMSQISEKMLRLSVLCSGLALCLMFAGSAIAKANKASSAPTHSEQAEIESVLREMEFLRERVQALQKHYGTPRSGQKIRFNYDALLSQMRTSEAGIREFLNARINEIHVNPPPAVGGSLIRVRPN
ncbi:MAG: RAQPRD family integrative conjugative element protein [Cardiobacteriaceae bacterium]|nr:RAQPRD family integrative conjugative element protein [Cardiobacteriaceae bacterium]